MRVSRKRNITFEKHKWKMIMEETREIEYKPKKTLPKIYTGRILAVINSEDGPVKVTEMVGPFARIGSCVNAINRILVDGGKIVSAEVISFDSNCNEVLIKKVV